MRRASLATNLRSWNSARRCGRRSGSIRTDAGHMELLWGPHDQTRPVDDGRAGCDWSPRSPRHEVLHLDGRCRARLWGRNARGRSAGATAHSPRSSHGLVRRTPMPHPSARPASDLAAPARRMGRLLDYANNACRALLLLAAARSPSPLAAHGRWLPHRQRPSNAPNAERMPDDAITSSTPGGRGGYTDSEQEYLDQTRQTATCPNCDTKLRRIGAGPWLRADQPTT
jgi:hypothetical protein